MAPPVFALFGLLLPRCGTLSLRPFWTTTVRVPAPPVCTFWTTTARVWHSQSSSFLDNYCWGSSTSSLCTFWTTTARVWHHHPSPFLDNYCWGRGTSRLRPFWTLLALRISTAITSMRMQISTRRMPAIALRLYVIVTTHVCTYILHTRRVFLYVR